MNFIDNFIIAEIAADLINENGELSLNSFDSIILPKDDVTKLFLALACFGELSNLCFLDGYTFTFNRTHPSNFRFSNSKCYKREILQMLDMIDDCITFKISPDDYLNPTKLKKARDKYLKSEKIIDFIVVSIDIIFIFVMIFLGIVLAFTIFSSIIKF